MKAAVVTKINCIEIMDLPMPKISDYEVLCKMQYGATCTGTDLHILTGCPWNIAYPIIMGHESIGEVVETGKKVRHFKIGDLITRVGVHSYPELGINAGNGWGGYAEYGIGVDHWAIKADGADVRYRFDTTIQQVVPRYIDPAEATLFITLRETLSYITRLGIKSGQDILIVGSGANALAFAAHAKIAGAGNIVVLGSKNKEAQAKLCGTTDYYDYKSEDSPKAIKEKYPQGFDVLLDAVGESAQLQSVFSNLKNNGVFGIYGLNEFGRASINPFSAKGSYRFYNGGYDEVETHLRIVDYFRENKINPKAFIDKDSAYPLEKIGEAFEDIKAKRLKDTKALIKLS